MEGKVFDLFHGAENTEKSDLNNVVNNVLESDNIALDGDEPDSYHITMKAKLMHPSTSPLDAAPINNMNNRDTDPKRRNSKVHSADGKEAGISQPSRYRMCRELFSYGPGYPSSPEPEPFYARYRKSGPGLITLHLFTGQTKGKTPVYVPVYERDDSGKLFRLAKKQSGHWQYVELKSLSEEEIEGGLKLWINPKGGKVLKTSEIEESVGRRTLADLRLRETKLKGG